MDFGDNLELRSFDPNALNSCQLSAVTEEKRHTEAVNCPFFDLIFTPGPVGSVS